MSRFGALVLISLCLLAQSGTRTLAQPIPNSEKRWNENAVRSIKAHLNSRSTQSAAKSAGATNLVARCNLEAGGSINKLRIDRFDCTIDRHARAAKLQSSLLQAINASSPLERRLDDLHGYTHLGMKITWTPKTGELKIITMSPDDEVITLPGRYGPGLRFPELKEPPPVGDFWAPHHIR